MIAKAMHYDYKKKLNKVDSQQYRNLLVPEIDWVLNEAQDVFIALVANPRLTNVLGFEKTQRTIDEIRTLVVPDVKLQMTKNICSLPLDYRYFIKANAFLTKCSCERQKARIFVQKHGELFEEDSFYNSSFEWRVVNALFNKEGLEVYDDGTFTVDEVYLTYLKRPVRIHNAEDYPGGTYTLPSGEKLTGVSNCELPETTHSEIVDIAVMITTGELNPQELNLKLGKLQFNQLSN